MAEQQRIVIAERPNLFGFVGPQQVIYHLPDGPSVEDYQPVKCGGGVTMHGSRERVARSLVCPDCLAGRKTM